MWFLALVVGLVVTGGVGHLAQRLAGVGRETLGRQIEFARWPVCGASIAATLALARHETAGAVTWHVLAWLGGGLAGCLIYPVCRSAYRATRTLRKHSNDDQKSPPAR